MRFHVLGIGPIGSLVAFHLRRAVPATHPISLIVKNKRRARTLRSGGGIAIEHGGVAITQGGYDVEIFDPLEEVVFDFVYNKKGEMRLPPGTSPPWRRQGELGHAENLDIVQRPIESIIVCTKTHTTLPVFQRIKQRLSPSSTVVLLQNGMGVYDGLIANVFRNPLERPQFVLATTTHGARSKAQGDMIHTVHTGDGDLAFGIVPDPLGERDFELSKFDRRRNYYDRALRLDDLAPPPVEGEASDRCASLRETIAALSNLTDLNTTWQPMERLQIRIKRKLVVNAIVNPLTTIAQCANGALVGDWQCRTMTKRICDEAAAVFAAEAAFEARLLDSGETVERAREAPAGLRSHELENEVYRVTRLTSNNFSSMLQDMWKGRKTEIEFINGHLHRLGAKYGVPTPYNDMLYSMIKMRENIVPVARI